jgi:hypothetical protein
VLERVLRLSKESKGVFSANEAQILHLFTQLWDDTEKQNIRCGHGFG